MCILCIVNSYKIYYIPMLIIITLFAYAFNQPRGNSVIMMFLYLSYFAIIFYLFKRDYTHDGFEWMCLYSNLYDIKNTLEGKTK
jgi:hypothetical protein